MKTLPFILCIALAVSAHVARAADETPRLVVANALIVPLDWSERAPFRGYLVVAQSGRISAIGAGDAPKIDAPIFDAIGKIVMPGFLSGHNHLNQGVPRGRTASSGVPEWSGAGAGGGRAVQTGDTYAAVLHGSVDMLLGGITTFYNHASMGKDYESLTETLDGMLDSGGRSVFGASLPRLNEEFSHEQLMQFMADFLAHVKAVPEHERVLKVSIVSTAMSRGEEASRYEFDVLKAFPEMQLDMQMHYLELSPNVPRTYIEPSNFLWLAKYGVLGPNLTVADFIHPPEEILQQSAAAHVTMIWNPLSNGRLGFGVPDVRRYRSLGMVCGMGIDGQASADITDPFQNMRVGLYAQRFQHPGEDVFTPREMLHLHTIETARAIRVENDVGSLEVGKFADFIVIDPHVPDVGPVYDVYDALVYACSRANVTDVFVAGKPVIRAREYLPFDLKQFQANTRYRMERSTAARAKTGS